MEYIIYGTMVLICILTVIVLANVIITQQARGYTNIEDEFREEL